VYEELIKPLKYYMDINRLKKSVFSMPIEEVLNTLAHYDVLAWNLKDKDIYLVQDPETRLKQYLRASNIASTSKCKLKSAIELKFGIKLFREKDLRNILIGFLAHDIYEYYLSYLPSIRKEVSIVDDDLKIVGRADLVGPDFVIEIKTSRKMRKAHLYQVALYMFALHKEKGYIVYPTTITKLRPSSSLKRELFKCINSARNFHNIVHSMNLEELLRVFNSKCIKKIFNITVEELLHILEKEGFI